MAFSNLGNVVFLNPGGQLEYFYFLNGFADLGLQQAGADIKTPNGAKVVALDQKKRKLPNGQTTYFVDFRNEGPGGVFFNVQGGGAV